MVGTVLESGLEAELDEELGYSKYDYRNKQTNNNRNGYSEKTMKTSFGDMEIAVPRDRKGEFAPQLIKKQQTTDLGHLRLEVGCCSLLNFFSTKRKHFTYIRFI